VSVPAQPPGALAAGGHSLPGAFAAAAGVEASENTCSATAATAAESSPASLELQAASVARKAVWRRLAPALVVVIALGPRLWQLDLARFADDQATLLGSAASIVSLHSIPSTDGLAFTVGFRHPPLAAMLLALPVAVSRDPIAASAFMAVVDSLAALLVYLSACSLGGVAAGLFAGLLYALEPAAILYGRTVWNPDFVPFLAALAVFGMLQYWQGRSTLWQGIGLLAIGLGSQLHPQMAALLPVWLALGLAKRRWGWPSLGAVAIMAVTLIPYIGLQIREGGADLRGALVYLAAAKQNDAQVFAALADLFSGRAYTEMLLPSGRALPAFSTDALGWCWSLLLLAGLALVLIRRRPAELIAACCFALPIVLSLRHTAGVAPHYLLLLVPVGAILAGLALAAIQPALAALVVLLISAWSGCQYVHFQALVPEQGPTSNYGMPLRYALGAAALVRQASPDGPVYVADADEYAGTFPYLLPGITVKRFDGRYTLVFPHDDALYVADAADPFAYKLLAVLGDGPPATVDTPGGRPAFGLFNLPADAAQRYDQQAELNSLDVDVGHSVQVRGYGAAHLTAGQPSSALIEWQVTDSAAPTPGDLRQFAHLVDASGTTWSTGVDVRGYPRSLWQTGDVVLSSFELGIKPDAPTGGYWLETGFYEPVTGQRLPQYRNGAPAGTAARIGPLRVKGVSPQVAGPPLATFGGGQIALTSVARKAGEIVLQWQALRKPAADYTMFVHVVDASGQLVAQDDSPPKGGSYPTSLWDAGEVVDDAHPLTAPAGATLELGLYTQPDLRRVPVDGGSDHVTMPVPT
jgi:hypothetical protein